MPTRASQMANDRVSSAISCFAAQAEAQPGGRYSVVTEFMLRLLVRRVESLCSVICCPVAHDFASGQTRCCAVADTSCWRAGP